MHEGIIKGDSLKTGIRLENCMYFPSYLLEMPLSMTARIAYVLILNRTLHSEKRRKNANGELYCSFPTKELAELLDRGKTATRDAIDNLCFYGLIRKGIYEYNFEGIYYPLIPSFTLHRLDLDQTAGFVTIKERREED